MKSCSFFGHRKIEVNDTFVSNLKNLIEKLILEGITEFIFGSNSEFDDLCYQLVSKLKEKYPHIVRIFVHLSSESGITSLEEKIRIENTLYKLCQKKINLCIYEKSILSQKSISANKNAYIARNYEMIDMSDLCVFYYNENCYSETKALNQAYKTKSGTGYAFLYAKQKKKNFINTFNYNSKRFITQF